MSNPSSDTIKPPAEAAQVDSEGKPLVQVSARDASNYCQIVSLLGMEEEGDPVAEVHRMLTTAEPVAQTADSGRVDEVSFSTVEKVVKALCRIGHTFPESQEEQAARFESLVLDLCRSVQSHFDGLTAFAAQGQGDGKVAAWVEPDVIEAMQPDDDWDGADGVECMLLKERGEKHTVALFTRPAPPASPAGVPDEWHREWRGSLTLAAETLEVESEHMAEGAQDAESRRMKRAATVIRALLAAASPAGVPNGYSPTDAEVRDWLSRSDLDDDGRIYHWRAAIDDARSMHVLAAAPSAPEGGETSR